MASYTLNIAIDSIGVQNIQSAGQLVTIVKQVNVPGQSLGAAALPVAWVTFTPQQTNNLTWQEQYWIYETVTQIQAGVTIQTSSITDGPGQDGYSYIFENGVFTLGAGDQAPGIFGVQNQQGVNNLHFGLAQVAQLNGGSTAPVPINVMPVLNNELATFQPEETVSVFLQAYQNNGVVISDVTGKACTVTLKADTPVTLTFNDSTNQFVVSTPGMEDFLAVRRQLQGAQRA